MSYKYCKKNLLLLVLFLICGCATTGRKNSEVEIQDLKNQILVLETQIQEKNDLINDLKESLKNEQEKSQALTTCKIKPNTKKIQTALKNAGYNPGKIDGKMGKHTKSAIKKFQKDNGLKASGKVDERTWSILSKYLS